MLVAHPSVPVRNLQDLIAYAKANPNKLNCASAGVGSPHHLIAEIFKQRAGISLNHVPYKGAAQYMADLVGGQVDLAVSTLGPAMPHVQTGVEEIGRMPLAQIGEQMRLDNLKWADVIRRAKITVDS